MGWVWKDDVDNGDGDVDTSPGQLSSTAEDRCYTKKIVSSNCKTEEVEPGKFIRKCEKTEQLIKDCVGRSSLSLSLSPLIYNILCSILCMCKRLFVAIGVI